MCQHADAIADVETKRHPAGEWHFGRADAAGLRTRRRANQPLVSKGSTILSCSSTGNAVLTFNTSEIQRQ